MNVRAICEGRFTLPLPIEETVPAPGTVFSTESEGGSATWIVLERRDDGMRYARIAPGRIAGTISVSCAASSPAETEVAVTYDVTSLGPEGAEFVEGLRDGYDEFLESWRQEILDGLSASPA
jgi:hypothetical protein